MCPTTGVISHDFDDDGETAAGSRVAEMMRLMGCMNVAVIVTRWFGGVLLGPSRFKFINNSARDLLEQHGYCEESKKKKKSK
jgi:putative IMPACT (imprinted ancient) family translation regulator